MPLSPAAQSPAGRLIKTCVRRFFSKRSTSCSFSYGYGKRYSTALKPALAAASKRSRNSTSLNVIVKLAANLGIASLLRGPGAKAGPSDLESIAKSLARAPQKTGVAADGDEGHSHVQVPAGVLLDGRQDAGGFAVSSGARDDSLDC